jgi:hypothetical protein
MKSEAPNPTPARRDEANSKQIQMTQDQNPKQYDLEQRTYLFAKAVRAFVKRLPRTIANIEDVKQVVKASGSEIRSTKSEIRNKFK